MINFKTNNQLFFNDSLSLLSFSWGKNRQKRRISIIFFLLFFLMGMDFAYSQNKLSGISQKESDQKLQNLELFLLIGQSNMAGRALVEAADRDSLDRVFLFTGIEGDEWEKAANPFNKYSSIRKDLKMQKLGPGYTFARKMAALNPDKQFGMVVNAKGGTTLNEWLPGTHFYKEAVKRVKMAMAYGNLRGVVWHQGEGDANKTKSYIERISLLIDSLRVATGIPDLPFVAGQLSEDRIARVPFNQMILHLPEKIKYTGVATTEGTSTFDSTHFDTRSQRLLGERYADEMMKLLKNGNN